MEADTTNISIIVRRWRSESGMSLRQFAEELSEVGAPHVTFTGMSVCNWEHGIAPSPAKLLVIKDHTHVTDWRHTFTSEMLAAIEK